MWVRGHSRLWKMVPFESRDTVSYSHSIVTMAVSLAISEIFNVKEWCDLEVWVCSSRSLKIMPFDRPYTTFNWSAIVTIALYCTIFELFDVNIVTLKSGLDFTQGHWNWCHSKYGFLFAFYTPCLKKTCAFLFLSELCHISMNKSW